MQTTKQIILEKAGALFYRQGFHNTGMEEITRVVGVKKPSLYYHFESKTALGNGYIDLRAKLLFDMLESLLARAPLVPEVSIELGSRSHHA